MRRYSLTNLVKSIVLVLGFMALALLLGGCAASRSEIAGKFAGPVEKNREADRVSVFFLFRHLSQEHGYDSIPKLQGHGVKDFDNLFRDALGEISNISQYDTFMEAPNDVNVPKRRQELAGFRADHDYTLEITFFEESSFKQQCLSATITILTLTAIPMPYTWDYTITARLTDRSGRPISTYERKAVLDNWVELFLMFAYPFHPLEGKREEIYAESLHDIFRQIEAERILKKI